MKKYLLSICFFATLFVSAQSTSPRFATSSLGDNTGRVLTYGILTGSTGTMVSMFPKSYETLLTIPTTSSSPTFTANVSQSYYGDQLHVFIASNATGTRTITISTNLIGSATTQTLAASKKGHFDFIFDGAKYIQTSFTAEP